MTRPRNGPMTHSIALPRAPRHIHVLRLATLALCIGPAGGCAQEEQEEKEAGSLFYFGRVAVAAPFASRWARSVPLVRTTMTAHSTAWRTLSTVAP